MREAEVLKRLKIINSQQQTPSSDSAPASPAVLTTPSPLTRTNSHRSLITNCLLRLCERRRQVSAATIRYDTEQHEVVVADYGVAPAPLCKVPPPLIRYRQTAQCLLVLHPRPGVLKPLRRFFFLYRQFFHPSPATVFSILIEHTTGIESPRSSERTNPRDNSRDTEYSHVLVAQSIPQTWGWMGKSRSQQPLCECQRSI